MITANYCTCKDQECYDQNLYKIGRYIDLIDFKIYKINKKDIQISSWGYKSVTSENGSINKLNIYKRFLKEVYRYLKEGLTLKVTDTEVQNVLERVSIEVDHESILSKVKEDKSNQDLYLALNPGCFPYEYWERALYNICNKIGITVEEKTDSYQFIYDIVSKRLNSNCELYYTIDIIHKAVAQSCFDVNIKNLASCKVDYETIVENTSCDISYETYLQLLSCNISSKAIENIYKSGCTLGHDNGKVFLNTGENTCNLSDIKIESTSKDIDSNTFVKIINDGNNNVPEIIETLKNSYNNLSC